MTRTHPFAGGRDAASVTLKHKPLVWENMLGTVYALSPQGESKYFDYDWDAARAFAQVDECTDLRGSAHRMARASGSTRCGESALPEKFKSAA